MEEHFNENYIESHQYPKQVLKENHRLWPNHLSDQPQTVELTGELSMHGVTKTITVQLITQKDKHHFGVFFSVKTSTLALKSDLVRKQIDENVQIEVSLTLKPK